MAKGNDSAAPERVLFVHAHPDDETLATGATIATLVDRGAQVTVLTCTRGELGEVIPVGLRHLMGSELGEYRVGELREALAALGVTDHRLLGEANARWEGREVRRYLDSGMRWGDSGAIPLDSTDGRSLSAAEVGEVAADIAAVILAVEPDVVVSYAADGGYGHPDHIRAHDATRTACEVLAVPFYVVGNGKSGGGDVVVAVEGDVLDRKRRALEAYGTQVTVTGDEYTLSSGGPRPIAAVESFTRFRSAEPALTDYGIVARIVTVTVAAALGLFAGALLTAAHQASVTIAGVPVPWGVIAALLIVVALLVGLRYVFESRVVALAAGVGVLIASGLLALQSGGSPIFVPGNVVSYLWIFGPVLLGTVVLTWPSSNRSAGVSGPTSRTR
ncbi:MAG: PIG-L family deacetylase [Salinibacterium sp.]|nr:PIG-L family deacetylase [Salinibacterium sp.]